MWKVHRWFDGVEEPNRFFIFMLMLVFLVYFPGWYPNVSFVLMALITQYRVCYLLVHDR